MLFIAIARRSATALFGRLGETSRPRETRTCGSEASAAPRHCVATGLGRAQVAFAACGIHPSALPLGSAASAHCGGGLSAEIGNAS